MKIEIKINQKNDLLERTLVEGKLTFDANTPSNNDFSVELAKVMKGDISLIVVKQIQSEFGKKEATFKAYFYDSIEAKQKNERITKHLKKKAEEVAKKEAEEKKTADEAVAKEAEQIKEEEEPTMKTNEELSVEKPVNEVKEKPVVEKTIEGGQA